MSLVEPSTSVKTKVTVPAGSARSTRLFKREEPHGVDPRGDVVCALPKSAPTRQCANSPTSGRFGYLPTFVIGALRTMCASFRVSLFDFASDLIWSSLTSKTGLAPDFHVTYISSQRGL